jgi:effector-binding domain-containing protein
MQFPCEIKFQPSRLTLSLRTHTPLERLPAVIGEVFESIERYLESLGETPAGPPFVIYYNMDMSNLDVEIGFPVHKALPGAADLKASVIPAGRIAACLYTGTYSGIEAGYTALTDWVKAQHVEPTGIAMEFYLSDPDTTPPDKLKTEIIYPLKAA